MPRAKEAFSQLYIANVLKDEVKAWVNQGWSPSPTQTTLDLLNYWFNRDEEMGEKFYPCQRRAIETIIYCHEILRIKNLKELFEKLAPEALFRSKPLLDEVESIPFPKYCLKMATGSGKTWVLLALLVWQYFNTLNKEREGQYSYRFLIVAPGRDVLNRLLDAFKGKKDFKTGSRDPSKSDLNRSLFMPDSWREKFRMDILEPLDVRANMNFPTGSFAYLTNWQQFRLKKERSSLWEKYTGEDIEESSRGEVIRDFLSEFPDLIVMNDEAHHVHGEKTAKNEELVWRHFIRILYDRIKERHSDNSKIFQQIDFSATPFFGSREYKEYFPHIVYDYDLVQAMRDMLVKQLFLEERQSIAGEKIERLDFRAKREEGEIVALSQGQKLLLDIGRKKLEQLAAEFKGKGIDKKPVLMVLCEETKVADLVKEHFSNLTDENGNLYDDTRVLAIHDKLPKKQLEEARKNLDKIDINDDPLRVVISVLMLREGFDKNNIAVTVVLRAAEADLLLEQIVGRGLRLMFPKEKYPEFWQSKVEAVEDIRRNKPPSTSLDFLFVVEHPHFRRFYEGLRQEGYLIGSGNSGGISSTGDIMPVDADPKRIEKMDIGWPIQFFEQGKMPDIEKIDVSKLRKYSYKFLDLKKYLGKLTIQETYVISGKKIKIWKLDNKYFDYNFFLERASNAVAKEGKTSILSGKKAEIAGLIDEYVTNYLFGETIDFSLPENHQVLNFTLIFDHVINEIRKAIINLLGEIHYETRGRWRKLSDVGRIMVKEKYSVETSKCIYPRQSYSVVGGGFERDFILEILELSIDVKAYAKLLRKHNLKIPYRDENGIKRDYEVDFIVKTDNKVYLVETKSDREIKSPNVAIKARAAKSWCENASTVLLPGNLSQPREWEYLILSENLYKSNKGLSFRGLIPLCQNLRDKIIAENEGLLFI